MQELNFDIPEIRLKINGYDFEVIKSDAEILTEAFALEQTFRSDMPKDEAEIIEAIGKVHNYVDTILGPGALAKISNGKAVSFKQCLRIMTEICSAVLHYDDEYIASEYSG